MCEKVANVLDFGDRNKLDTDLVMPEYEMSYLQPTEHLRMDSFMERDSVFGRNRLAVNPEDQDYTMIDTTSAIKKRAIEHVI